MSKVPLQWIVGDDTGMSSIAIWSHFMGVEPEDGWQHPVDPSDLGRCLRLLALMPEWAVRIDEMAKHSPKWAGLCQAWPALAALMQEEVGIDWSKGRRADKTYEAMKVALGERR